MELSKEKIAEAKANGVAVAFTNVFDSGYSWDNFINHINDVYDKTSANNGNYDYKQVVGLINIWHKFTYTLEGLNSSNFPDLDKKYEYLKTMHPNQGIGYFGAVSLTSKEPTTGNHTDPIDVMYCQFIGSVIWKIEYEDRVETFVLNPRDMIYVPKGLMHEVTSLTPRAAISFMFDAS
jgi:hypothetical protein